MKKGTAAAVLAATLTTLFLVEAGLAQPQASMPVVSGKWLTADNMAISNTPIAIIGTTASGEAFSAFWVTAEDGTLEIFNIPAGTYEAVAAFDSGSMDVSFTVERPAWYEFWKSLSPVALGEVKIDIESSHLPDIPLIPFGQLPQP